jgi:hypothetical protein
MADGLFRRQGDDRIFSPRPMDSAISRSGTPSSATA